MPRLRPDGSGASSRPTTLTGRTAARHDPVVNQLLAGFFVVAGLAMLIAGGAMRNAGSAEGGLVLASIGLIWMLVGGLVLVQMRRSR